MEFDAEADAADWKAGRVVVFECVDGVASGDAMRMVAEASNKYGKHRFWSWTGTEYVPTSTLNEMVSP